MKVTLKVWIDKIKMAIWNCHYSAFYRISSDGNIAKCPFIFNFAETCFSKFLQKKKMEEFLSRQLFSISKSKQVGDDISLNFILVWDI